MTRTGMDAGESRRRILEIALDRFVHKGYAATTLKEIAARMGFSQAALYYHFPAKEDLLHGVVTPFLDAFERLLDDADARASADHPGVRAVLDDYANLLLEHLEVARYVDGEPAVRQHPELAARLDAATQRLRRLIANGRDDAMSLARAASVIGVVRRPLLALDVTDIAEMRYQVVDDAMLLVERLDPRRG